MERKRASRYTDEFKAGAVERHQHGGRSLAESAREIGVSTKSLGQWVAAARADKGQVQARVFRVVDAERDQGEAAALEFRVGQWSVQIKSLQR